MNILFCTDGSKISYSAILNFSKWVPNCVIDIVNVLDLSFLPDFISLENSNWECICKNTSDEILDHTETFFNENNLVVGEKIKKCGSTVDSISGLLEKYDFVVMGSNGKQGLQKWLGSVSQEVASLSQIPVFISKMDNSANKVLFTIADNENNISAIKDSILKLNLQNKEIYIATVYEIPDYMFLEGNLDFRWIDEVSKKQERSSQILLNSIEKIFNEANLSVKDMFILKGIPAQEIIKLCSKFQIDMVVVSSAKKKSLSKMIFGSVSLRILSGSKSDVLILKY